MVKPTEVRDVPPGLLERTPNAGQYIADALKAEGVEYIFAVMGGHCWPWLDPAMQAGIKQVTTRHEETGGYAAEAYCRISGKTGVCIVTVGPGATNIFSPVHEAFLSATPMVVLCGDHECVHDGLFALQESYIEKYFSSITKFTKRVITNGQYKYWVRRAFQEAWEPRRGPVVLGFEMESLVGRVEPAGFYIDNWVKEPMKPPVADSADVAKIAKLIYEAERPCIMVGDGIMWSRTSKELVEFAELAQVPVMGRRGGRGAIPEDHPLFFKSAGVVNKSDLFVLWGTRLDFFDNWGYRWNINRAIQINDDMQCLHGWVPTELAVKADPGAVLKQVLAYVKENGLKAPDRASWINQIQDEEKIRRQYLMKNAARFNKHKPIHGLHLAKTVYETINDLYNNDVIYCGDSYTGWNLTNPYVIAKSACGVLDAGSQAGVGHGIGHAIGAALGTDRKKLIFAMMGDAGMGIAGMDIETASRLKLPIVFCVYNNDMWLTLTDLYYGKNFEALPPEVRDPGINHFLKDIRYDKMFENVGCHGEWVTEPDELRPSLERAFKAAEQGQPAVVNVDVSNDPIQSVHDGPIGLACTSHVPWSQLTNISKKHRRKHGGFMFQEGFDKLGIELEDYDRYERVPGDFDVTG